MLKWIAVCEGGHRNLITAERVRCAVLALLLALLLALAAGEARAGESVRVENASHRTRCAEEDNVYVKLLGAGIRHLTIEARHPAYLARLTEDNKDADFSDCTPGHDPSFAAEPKDVVLYDGPEYRLMGHSFAGFWRKAEVPFRVGAATTPALHLVQLFRKLEGEAVEVLVVYPPDGYWRAKPLPPKGHAETAYGSSFLVGPIEEERRPFVVLTAIEFVPAEASFRLSFRDGAGSLRVAEASRERTRIEVTLPPGAANRPFAALRSMFVSTEKADTAEAVLPDASPIPVLGFTAAETRAVTFARSQPGHHNKSAPDITFGDFGR